MNKLIVAMLAMAVSASAAPAEPAAAPAATQPTEEQVIAQFKQDLAAKRADVMAKGLTLTAEQASKFWPLFEEYQKEQNVSVDAQIKATQAYNDNFATLTDAQALEYVNALLARDEAAHDLRVKWLAKFQTVVPPKVAARAIQLDRRLSQVVQIQVSSQIPLITQ
jgi:Spy/CpxP family protein refolding chaperone